MQAADPSALRSNGGESDALGRRAALAREWLLDAAFPFWFERGIDRQHGGFRDLVNIDGTSVPGAPKRMFVQARQIFAFASAGEFGWKGSWREAVVEGCAILRARFRHPEGGFLHSLDCFGEPYEYGRDLYDQAFAAFAFAHASRVLDDEKLVDEARSVFRMLDERWARPPAGYWEGELTPPGIRRQNPHMHLLEAALAIAATRWKSDADLACANRLGELFANHFLDRGSAALPEIFEEDWSPRLEADCHAVEPGHHFEWVWLFHLLATAGGNDLRVQGVRLWEFARFHGVDDRRNVAVDEVDSKGRTLSPRARLWPQTERIKAALALAQWTGSPRFLREAVLAFDGLQQYFGTPVSGAFFDKLKADGTFENEPARASSFYHIVGAYLELMRFAR
jgi:mannose/cellobiose epimerase-like protein (N-acyl-D-glucosamine 2-epimerase family)